MNFNNSYKSLETKCIWANWKLELLVILIESRQYFINRDSFQVKPMSSMLQSAYKDERNIWILWYFIFIFWVKSFPGKFITPKILWYLIVKITYNLGWKQCFKTHVDLDGLTYWTKNQCSKNQCSYQRMVLGKKTGELRIKPGIRNSVESIKESYF